MLTYRGRKKPEVQRDHGDWSIREDLKFRETVKYGSNDGREAKIKSKFQHLGLTSSINQRL